MAQESFVQGQYFDTGCVRKLPVSLQTPPKKLFLRPATFPTTTYRRKSQAGELKSRGSFSMMLYISMNFFKVYTLIIWSRVCSTFDTSDFSPALFISRLLDPN